MAVCLGRGREIFPFFPADPDMSHGSVLRLFCSDFISLPKLRKLLLGIFPVFLHPYFRFCNISSCQTEHSIFFVCFYGKDLLIHGLLRRDLRGIHPYLLDHRALRSFCIPIISSLPDPDPEPLFFPQDSRHKVGITEQCNDSDPAKTFCSVDHVQCFPGFSVIILVSQEISILTA